MKKKLIISIGILLATLLLATPVFAWFYFPNSKGLEIDTPKAEDISIKLYKLFNTYNDDGTYASSYFQDLTDESYKDSNDHDVDYLQQDGYVIPESFEFFEWGDEFICESTDAIYYALECSYDSSVYKDGYVKSILTTSLGSRNVVYGENNEEIAFPILDASYKFASQANAMENSNDYISEIQSDSGYKKITERYYTKNNSNDYVELNPTNFDDFDIDEDDLYVGNLIEFTSSSFVDNTTYYEYAYEYDSITYKVTSDNTPNVKKRYFTGTFSPVSDKNIAFGNDNNYDYIFTDISSDVFYSNLNSNQYFDSSDNTLKFVIFIKITPNEEFVTDIMYGIRNDIDETKTEIVISNDLKFTINLRSVPKREGTITSTTNN